MCIQLNIAWMCISKVQRMLQLAVGMITLPQEEMYSSSTESQRLKDYKCLECFCVLALVSPLLTQKIEITNLFSSDCILCNLIYGEVILGTFSFTHDLKSCWWSEFYSSIISNYLTDF